MDGMKEDNFIDSRTFLRGKVVWRTYDHFCSLNGQNVRERFYMLMIFFKIGPKMKNKKVVTSVSI